MFLIYVLLCSEKIYVPSRPVDVNVSLVLGGLHQRSGVALRTGGRADPAIGNEAPAGTRRSVFFGGGDVALYCTYVPGIILS